MTSVQTHNVPQPPFHPTPDVEPDAPLTVGSVIWLPDKQVFQIAWKSNLPSTLFTGGLQFLRNNYSFNESNPTPTKKQKKETHLLDTSKLRTHIERALKDFHHVSRLACNPLVKWLPLYSYRREEDVTGQADGLALHRFLEHLICTLTGTLPCEEKQSEWRVEQYLYLRYHLGIAHRRIAFWTQYTERHLHRKRHALLQEATHFLEEVIKAQKDVSHVSPHVTLMSHS